MDADTALESQIAQWRGYVERHQAISAADAEEMEDHLRSQISDLTATGLMGDEAFLVAVKRMGNMNGISREFAREHSNRLWKQLVLMPAAPDACDGGPTRELWTVLALAVGAAVAVKVGLALTGEHAFARNAGLFGLPFLTAYFAWKRRMPPRAAAAASVLFVVAAAAVNGYPFRPEGATEVIAAIHTPIVLWFVVGLAYAGGRWRSDRRRMDFIRFTGEWIVYLALLGIGGGVLVGLTVGAFDALGIDVERVIESWVLPFGVAGAVVVAAWLVEAKQNVVENIAPVLTRVFTPLTILMLLVLLVAFAAAGTVVGVDRNLLILMDFILVLVLGLVLYAISARDPRAPADLFDRLQLVLVLSALAVDLLMLIAMLTRIAEFGVTPNKVTALGLNLVLLVNLTWSARLLAGFVRGRVPFSAAEHWQTRYLPVFGLWAAVALIVIPPAFDFV